MQERNRHLKTSEKQPMKPIDKARAESALNFLIETDEEFAVSKTEAKRAELFLKKTKAAIFLTSKGSVEAKKAEAEVARETEDAEKAYLDAEQDYETLRNRRDSATLVWEHWRSLNSARKQGIIV